VKTAITEKGQSPSFFSCVCSVYINGRENSEKVGRCHIITFFRTSASVVWYHVYLFNAVFSEICFYIPQRCV